VTQPGGHPDPAGELAGVAAPGLVLELVLVAGEPLSGTVGPIGGSARVPFQGWIALMSAIGQLRNNAGAAGPLSGPGRSDGDGPSSPGGPGPS
jgi:hypothetical protein